MGSTVETLPFPVLLAVAFHIYPVGVGLGGSYG